MLNQTVPLRIRRTPIFALYAANAISMLGNVLAAISIPWFVLQTTGSAAQTGLTAFFTILPQVGAAFFGGILVDRLGYKRTSIIADSASTVAIGLIPLLYATGGLQFWQLLALVFVGNLLDAPGTTAREAIVPDLAQLAAMRLERATASSQIIERSSRLLGAPLAGILIAFIGASQVLWVDAATFGVSAVLVAWLVPTDSPHETGETAPQSVLVGLTSGLRFIWQDKLIRIIVFTVMITNLLDSSFGSVIYPVYVKQFFGQALVLGLSFAASGGGAVIGAIIFAAVGHRLSYRTIFVGGFVITGLRFGVVALVPPFWVLILTMLITGLAAGPLNPIIGTIEFSRIPPAMRGRVLGAITAGVNIATPLGVLLAGVLLETLDIRLLLGLIGAIYVLITGSLFFNPVSRQMDSLDPSTAKA